MARIAVFGLGYVGCTTTIGFAELGHTVHGYDISEDKVQALSNGKVPIFEEGLQESLDKSIELKKISFTNSAKKALEEADFVFLCVPTPMNADGSADLTFLETALAEIELDLHPKTVLVFKSTLPLGTGGIIQKKFENLENSIVYNPEFLREGTALSDFRNPDRIVIGSESENAARQTASLYRGIQSPVIFTGFSEAELIKYASNAFLAVKISFINEIAHLAQVTNINVHDVATGMGLDKRIGSRFLSPGPGWGGSCFPKDSRELVVTSEKHNVTLRVLEAAITANEETKNRIAETATNLMGGTLKGKSVAVLGLAFKAGTDDVRDSPALEVISKLIESGAKVKAYDPVVKTVPFPDVELAESAYGVSTGADLLLVMTEWPEFASLNPKKVIEQMAAPNVIDTRSILPYREWKTISKTFLALGGHK